MALILELFENRQIDFSIDPELFYDLLDQMIADCTIRITSEYHVGKYSDSNEPLIFVSDFPAILEKLKFTLISEIKHNKLLISLFAPASIRMEINHRKKFQPHVRSSSSG